jgi:2-keto-4-pentenoate hydratase
MTPDSVQKIAGGLQAARGEAWIADLSEYDLPRSVAEAYAVQSELIALAGDRNRGWKVTALGPEDQRKFGSDRAVAGPLLEPYVHASPAALWRASFLTPLLECEVAFLLGADLPPRASAYQRGDIEAAIAAVVPVFEVVDARVPPEAADLTKLADCIGNGGFITGTPVADWRDLDLRNIAITLSVNGVVTERGTSARILGDPLLAVLALANAQPLSGALKAGQIVTTGTCTTPLAVTAGDYAGDFGPLGKVSATFT